MGSPSIPENTKTDFDRDGFVVLHRFFDAAGVRQIAQEIERYVTQVAPQVAPGFAMYEDVDDPATLKQLSNIAHNDDELRRFLDQGPGVALAELLLGDPVCGSELEWFDKPPARSRHTPPHQDGYYFKIEPKQAVTIWIALDPVDEQNGCIRYVAGSHRDGLRPHQRTDVLGFSQGITDYGPADHAREIAVTADPGDVLAHHCLTLHRADANPGPRHRRALGLIYYSARVKVDDEAADAYLKSLHEDLKEQRKI